MLPRRERRARGGGTVESTQVDRAEGSTRERAEGPKRAKRAGPFKLPARGVQEGMGKWPGAALGACRSGKLTEPRGPAAKKGGQGEANGQLLGDVASWLLAVTWVLDTGRFRGCRVPRNALLCESGPQKSESRFRPHSADRAFSRFSGKPSLRVATERLNCVQV